MNEHANSHLASLLSPPEWLIEEPGFKPEKINFYETIFTVGNGYQGTRAALEEGFAGGLPGTYLAGVYDHHDSTVVDLVSAPDWLPVRVYVDGEILSLNTCKVLEYRRTLDIKQGLLYRSTVFEDKAGRRTRYESVRFASYANQHLAAMRVVVTPENYDAELVIESGIEGTRRNLDRLPQYVGSPRFPIETKWEKWAKSKHLQETANETSDNAVYLQMRTLDRDHQLGYAASAELSGSKATRKTVSAYEQVKEVFHFQAKQGESYQLDKLVAIGTSRDLAKAELKSHCLSWLSDAKQAGLDQLLEANKVFWQGKWQDSDCQIHGDERSQQALRFNIYHILIAANENDPKANIGAKSLSGEGYKGHVFWDSEIFLLPFFIYTQPETAKALLLYRYHCLGGAQKNAADNGCVGAQYPWESADTGEEVTPKWTADGKNRFWTGEEEIHITSDVAYGVLTYLNATNDWAFFLEYGAEILFNTARFWTSKLEYSAEADRYELKSVIGPDEFHEHVDNNVYTNWLAQWNLNKAAELYEYIGGKYPQEQAKIKNLMQLADDEIVVWRDKAKKIYIPIDWDKKLIEQYEGYFQCKNVPISEWDENHMPKYPKGYDHFNTQETMLIKQPDVVMLMYVLPDEFDDEIKRINYEFYEERTLHKSSLSPSIHSIMGIEVGDTSRAQQYFERSAFVDLINNQGNTEMGMHIASAGGTWMCAVFGFGGFRVKNETLTFKPWLPENWTGINFKLYWRGDQLEVSLKKEGMAFYRKTETDEALTIEVFGECYTLAANETTSVSFS